MGQASGPFTYEIRSLEELDPCFNLSSCDSSSTVLVRLFRRCPGKKPGLRRDDSVRDLAAPQKTYKYLRTDVSKKVTAATKPCDSDDGVGGW
jgi:hypothetical protein